jgi:hypothetical protein
MPVRVWGIGTYDSRFVLEVWSCVLWAEGVEFPVESLGIRVQGSGFRV